MELTDIMPYIDENSDLAKLGELYRNWMDKAKVFTRLFEHAKELAIEKGVKLFPRNRLVPLKGYSFKTEIDGVVYMSYFDGSAGESANIQYHIGGNEIHIGLEQRLHGSNFEPRIAEVYVNGELEKKATFSRPKSKFYQFFDRGFFAPRR